MANTPRLRGVDVGTLRNAASKSREPASSALPEERALSLELFAPTRSDESSAAA